MQLELYNALKTQLETISDLKLVALWNNQYQNESENVSFDFPNVFIEFANIEYTDQTKGVQSYEMDVILHLGFESYKNEDTAILTLKQTVHSKVHMKSFGAAPYETRLLRRSETQNFDHNNIQEYLLTYHVSGKDFGADTRLTTEATVTTLVTNVELDIDNITVRTGDGTF